MDKETFLRLQYLRMLNSDEFVVELWKSSLERFMSDLWDRTPNSPAGRFLAPVDPTLGYSPDNVEWQFPKIKRRPVKSATTKPYRIEKRSITPLPTKEERKQSERAAREAIREAKRKAIAEEFARWGQQRANRG